MEYLVIRSLTSKIAFVLSLDGISEINAMGKLPISFTLFDAGTKEYCLKLAEVINQEYENV